jgi:hypothetical protein
MEWEEEDGFQRGEGRTAVAHSDEVAKCPHPHTNSSTSTPTSVLALAQADHFASLLTAYPRPGFQLSPRSLRIVYVGLACMAAAVVATGAVVMTSSTPSTPVKESVPSLYEESQSFLRMARSTEGYSVEMSDDDCSEIETALDDCFDDSKNVVSHALDEGGRRLKCLPRCAVPTTGLARNDQPHHLPIHTRSPRLFQTTEVSCLDIKELILDEVCDDSYTVSDDVVDYMYDYYEVRPPYRWYQG